jgi:sterol desaturase/sphingolipid hydroxylase (fatty acid hydroxylase superfamily)
MESGLSLGVGTILGFTLVTALLLDFTQFFAHYLFHQIPILWQFHQVHHSARVLTPFTWFREHPVDNLIRASFFIVVIGFLLGSKNYLFLEPVHISTFFGTNIFIVTYSFTSQILIHSHIPFYFPPLLANIFTSPLYHQVHHSTDPRLHHKNMAVAFTFWDRLFQTQYMPAPDQKLIFGLSRGVQEEHGNLFEALFKPFGETFKVVVGKR